MRILLMGAFLLGTQDPSELDRLIRSLGSESVAVREKAQDRLFELGEQALPALRKAAADSDPEIRQRATLALQNLERLEIEKKHYAKEREVLLKGSGMAQDKEKEEKYWQVAWTGGAVFRFGTRPWKGGLVLSTHFRNYLSKSYEDGLADLKFDIVGIADKEGKVLSVDRCGLCSPYTVYAKDTSSALKPHVRGSQLWFSTYTLEFPNPKDGDRQKVGDFTIEVAWPTLKVTSRHPYPKDRLARVCQEFSYDVIPGARSRSLLFDSMGVRVGGGGGGRRGGGGQGDEWCSCQGGPKPAPEGPKPELASELIVKIGGYVHPLKEMAKIQVRFHKPIEESFDLTPEIQPK